MLRWRSGLKLLEAAELFLLGSRLADMMGSVKIVGEGQV